MSLILDKYARIVEGEFVAITNRDYEKVVLEGGGQIDGRLIYYKGNSKQVWDAVMYLVKNLGYILESKT